MFNINIAIYILKINEYVNYAFYYSCNNFVDIIRINFINRNHFELLCHKDDKILTGEYANNINKEELKNKYVNKIKNNNSLITTNEIKENIKFPNKYVAYNNKYVPNKYNEIYIYLKSKNNSKIESKDITKEILPKRLYDDKLTSNPSTRHKKRLNFWKDSNNNYFIDNENRLCYKYNPQTNNDTIYKKEKKILIKKIPFEEELIPLLSNAHICNGIHNNLNEIKKIFLNGEFYWNSITKEIGSYIEKCEICKVNLFGKKINMPLKQITPEYPHYRYLADIWYLPDTIISQLEENNTNEKYVLDIIDHITKYLKSYGLRNKTSKEVLIYIKDFVYNVGSPKIFQFDNGSEFRNNEIQSFMHNMGIEVVYSAPYHPQTNGAVETLHKEIKRFVSNKFVLNTKDFNLSEALTEANYYQLS